MTKLGYSNRGGRGGSRSQSGRTPYAMSARGRGASKTWVRPNQQTTHTTGDVGDSKHIGLHDNGGVSAEMSNETTRPERTKALTKDTSAADNAGESHATTTTSVLSFTTSSGPILRGPRSQNFHEGRFSNAHVHSNRGRGRGRNSTWHRDGRSDKEQTWNGTAMGDSKALHAITENSSTVPSEQPQTQQHHEKKQNLQKVGTNKLMLLSRRKAEDNSNEQPGFGKQRSDVEEITRKKEDSPSQKHARRGAHSLVLLTRRSASSDADDRTTSAVATTEKNTKDNTADPSEAMVHQGSNKLVLLTRRKAAHDGSPKDGEKDTAASFDSRWNHRTNRIESSRGGRRRRPQVLADPNVKRIKLSSPPPATSSHKKDSGDNEREQQVDANTDEERNESKEEAAQETLTDFAYRQTSSNRGRGGRSVSGRGRGRQHMGLVRVNPESTTRICPTFLRGVRCEDERCVKRHDVPREYAMPVCSFFQRHGQCLKGSECQFRHVKVNPRAEICPCFQLLGFCEDEKCLMQHVTPNASAIGKSTSNANHGHNKYQRRPT